MIQSPEIQNIRDKELTQGWPKLITSISVQGLHGFNDKTIQFKFPICAIVGENGTGKSTLLKIIACAYKSHRKTFYPSEFFPDTTWDKLQGIKVTYQIRLGAANPTSTFAIRKPTRRWRGITERPINGVFYFDLNRTQSIESIIGYSKLAKREIVEASSRNLSGDSLKSISEIMGRNYLNARYAKTQEDENKEIGVLKFGFGELSQFHQGTGETIVTNLISAIENIPEYSLVIIDEIETSLHPKAQRRLIRQLLALTRIKTLQVILSTHSPYILSELPKDARILLTRTNEGVEVIYAPTVEFCLSQIDDILHSEVDILVEDKEAQAIVSEIIRLYLPEVNNRVRILSAGPANVVRTLSQLSFEKKLPYNIVGVVDADQVNMTPALTLPGQYAPEKQIIGDIATLSNVRLSQILSLPEQEVKKELIDIQLVLNYHEWVQKLSNRFNVPESTLWTWLVSIWVKDCLSSEDAQLKELIEAIKARL